MAPLAALVVFRSRVNFCLTDQSDAVALKAQVKIDKAASKVGAKIAKVCGGDDRTCGTFDVDEATPDGIGFYAVCPGFEGRGSCTGGTNDQCRWYSAPSAIHRELATASGFLDRATIQPRRMVTRPWCQPRPG